MDVRDINNTYVAENCVRTDGTDTSLIDGKTVTGCQIHAPLRDDGAATTTYYGPGELVITDGSGRVLTDATALKAVPEIAIHQRSSNGLNHFGSKLIQGKNITSYNIFPYDVPVEQVAVLKDIDATLQDFSYMIKIRRVATDNNYLKQTTVKTAYFKSAAAGSTSLQILTGLAAYINTNFYDDPLVPVVASIDTDELVISALPYPYDPGKFFYEKLHFVVELVEFTGTVTYNVGAQLVENTTYEIATAGAGTWMQVTDQEIFGKLYTGANKKVQSPVYRRDIVDLDAEQYEDDGIAAERYDTLVINWTNAQGDFSMNVRQEGTLTIFLPVEDNTTSQVAEPTGGNSSIVQVLDKYIVTEWGVGAAQIGKLTTP